MINTLKNITTSNPSGYVKAGEAYSAVLTVTSGYMLPERVTVTINGNVLTTEDYAYSSETGLLAIAADKITGSVEIIATGAKKTWCIELDSDEVDFGTLPFGDDVPAAQTVTIKNTGNQPVTVGLPELDFGEDAFVFTQGDGYTGGQAAIAADAAASFTVQPKTGLPVGDYAFTTYTINGSNDTEAELFVNFEVTTRGMVVTILARMEGVSTDGSPWYEAGRRWAMANNISDGTNMESPVTREQLAAILYRYAAYKGADVSVGEQAGMQRYTDASAISEYAVPAMQWACGTGLLQGAGSKLLPKGLAIRTQLAAMLHRYLTK